MKNKQPVLIFLTPGFPKDEDDTSCLPFLQSLIKTINKNFPFVKIIILSFQYPFDTAEYLWHNNQVISFGGKNKGKFARRLLWFRVYRKLKQLNNDNNIVGIFSLWCGECALLGNRFGGKYNITHRCWILGQDAKENNKYVQRIKPHPEDLIALSDFIADEFFKNHLIRPLHIIPNGIDKSLFHHDAYEKTIDIMGVGSLISLKRYDLFINCIAELKKKNPAIKSLLIGKGPEEQFLLNKIKRLNLQNSIELKGELPHFEVLKLMQQCKIFLHPSSYEGFGMVCIEALYAGCQVISFCKPMNACINHWHIMYTPDEMRNKTNEILNNPNTRYTSVLAYSIEENTKALMQLFNLVI